MYLVTVPNKEFDGTTCGVRFNRGVAYISEATINKRLGYSAEEIATRMEKEFGYHVVEVDGGLPMPPVQDPFPASEPAPEPKKVGKYRGDPR